MSKLIIYDFDGVIAESEVLANTVLAEIVSELGIRPRWKTPIASTWASASSM